MAVTFILGRAGTGKTRLCLDAILAELARPQERRRLILLVPEQASFQMERALATGAPRGVISRARVLSFSRLAIQVSEETGATPGVISAEGRRLALRHVVAEWAGQLPAFRRFGRTPGFIAQLDQVIATLLREDVTPAALRAAAERLSGESAERVAQLALIYQAYVDWLGPARCDPAGRLAVLRARLGEVAWLPEASIWVDGFAGFTGQELETLTELARRAREVYITLLLDPAAPGVRVGASPPDPLGLFQHTELTLQGLRRRLDEAGVSVAAMIERAPPPARFRDTPELARLEAGLATPVGLPVAAVDAVPAALQLRGCTTPRDEVRAAARWILGRMAESAGTLRFRDFALIARDLEPFGQVVAEVFGEYGIPYFLDRRRALRGHPLTRLVPAVFAAARTDLSVEAMVRLLRTRLLPVGDDAAAQMENVVARDAVRGAALWRKARWELERVHEIDEAVDAGRMRIVGALDALLAVEDEGGIARGSVWAEALWRVLDGLEVRARLGEWMSAARAEGRFEAVELHRQAWEAVCALLDDLHEVLGDARLEAEEVATLCTQALEGQTLGLAPPTLDQVLVSSIDRSRHPEIKHVWVFGFNEGVFPARPAQDALLSTSERAELARAGLTALGPHREDAFGERLLAYIAFTRPSDELVVSFATVSLDGDALQPSPLVAELTRVFPRLEAVTEDAAPAAVCATEVAEGWLASRGEASGARWEALREALRAEEAVAARVEWLLRAHGERNTPEPIGNYRAPGGGDARLAWRGSASELETYLQCPFKHFARYGLRLDPERGPRPVRWDLGTAAHELLADVTRAAMRAAGDVRTLSDERWLALLDEAAARFWQRQPANVEIRRPDFALLGRLLVQLLRDVVRAHAARWRRGEFGPVYCEEVFGAGGRLPAVVLEREGGDRVELRGKIDRVDRSAAGLTLVYDYKSSADPVKLEFLTGDRLQLFVYVLALAQAEGEGVPAGVFLAPLYPDLKVLERKYAADMDEEAQRMLLFRPRGRFVEAAARALDASLGTTPSPVAAMQLKKGGGFHARSDVVSAGALADAVGVARRTIAQAAGGIVRGAIPVAPLVEGQTLACRWCEFRRVCRFDRALNLPRLAEAALPTLTRQREEGASCG